MSFDLSKAVVIGRLMSAPKNLLDIELDGYVYGGLISDERSTIRVHLGGIETEVAVTKDTASRLTSTTVVLLLKRYEGAVLVLLLRAERDVRRTEFVFADGRWTSSAG